MAQSAYRTFSGVSVFGTNWATHAVARYSLATARLGSNSIAFLKLLMALSNLLALYACTPLFSWSRARSLVHPVVASSIAAIAAVMMILVEIFLCTLVCSPCLAASQSPQAE